MRSGPLGCGHVALSATATRDGAVVFAVAITLACAFLLGAATPATAQVCPVCANFVTTVDSDGPGGQPPDARMHSDLVPDRWYVLDVDTQPRLPPLPVTSPVFTPGYEVAVKAEGLLRTAPMITIQRLPGLAGVPPPALPLRVEAVTSESSRRRSIGYDTLATSDTPASRAPGSFTATVDLSDRDRDPATDQAKAVITIEDAGKPLAVVSESFGGDPAGTRTNRKISRLEFSGNGIPRSVTADITSPSDLAGAPQRQTISLSRDVLSHTDLTARVSSPGPRRRGPTRTAARFEEMPPWLNVTLADVAADDGTKTQTVDYAAGSVVGRAVVTTTRPGDPSAPVAAEHTTRATVEALPTNAHLSYANPSGATRISYRANGRARRAELFTDDSKRQFSAEMFDLPTRIDKLQYTPRPAGGSVVYDSNARASHAAIRTREGPSELDVLVSRRPGDGPAVPTDIERLDYSSANGGFELDYDASEVVPRAEVRVERLIGDDTVEDPADTAPPHRRELTATVDDIPDMFQMDLDSAGRKLAYSASGRASRAHVTATDELPLFEHATSLDLLLEDLAPGLDAKLAAAGLEFCARAAEPGSACNNRVGKLELLGTNLPADRRPALPADADGVLVRNKNLPGAAWPPRSAEDYVLQGRVRGLRHALYRPGENTLELRFDADAPEGTDVVIDSVREVTDTLWTNRVAGVPGIAQKRDGTETIKASLEDYPSGMDLDMNTANGEIHIDYSADDTSGPLEYTRTTGYRPGVGPINVAYRWPYTAARVAGSYPASDFGKHTTASFSTMPKTFHACYVTEGSACSDGIWTPDMFEDFDPATEADRGSLRLTATGSRPTFTYNDQATVPTRFAYSRHAPEVEASGDPCAELLIVNDPPTPDYPICRYREQKPGRKFMKIELRLGDLVVQNHLERSGWVGHNISHILAGNKALKKGYVAMDTGWRNAVGVTGAPLCAVLGRPLGDCVGDGLLAGEVGVYPPPEEATVRGGVGRGGFLCTQSEDCGALESRFPASVDDLLSFGAEAGAVTLGFGDPFGAQHRVFEFNPDDFTFAKHKHGFAYCGQGTNLRVGTSAFTDRFCNISLPGP